MKIFLYNSLQGRQQASPDDDAQLEERVAAAAKWIRDFAITNFLPLGEIL